MLKLLRGDALKRLKELRANSVDSLVTDPPAGISFMGKDWDHGHGGTDNWIFFMRWIFKECFRVMKPGAHGLVWALPRTSHRTALSLERAGFEIRDICVHVYGSGFPKSLNVAKSGAKAGISCTCEKVPYLSKSLDAKDALSARKKSNLQSIVRRKTNQDKGAYTKKTTAKVYDLRKRVSSTQPHCAVKSKDMLTSMQRHHETEKSCLPRASKKILVKHERKKGHSSVRSSQSRMEGRRHIQAKQRQLHRPKICQMSTRVHRNGEKRWVCNGTQASHGNELKKTSQQNRSRPSQRPQYEKQSSEQSRTLSQQSGTQACRRCRKPIIQPGLGTALKPASEHWILVRKPLGEKTVAKNVLKWGTGALNVDGSRIGMMTKSEIARSGKSTTGIFARGGIDWKESDRRPQGRFPANFVLSCCGEDPHDEDCAVGMLDRQSGMLKTGGGIKTLAGIKNNPAGWQELRNKGPCRVVSEGTASRFFYVAKPSRRERNEGCEGLTKRTISPADKWTTKDRRKGTARQPTEWRQEPQGNVHPTVKPLTLMRYLIRMVTPPRGLVLDPFLGSGTTGVAARAEGFCFIGIEKEKDYLKIARNRIAYQERKRAA